MAVWLIYTWMEVFFCPTAELKWDKGCILKWFKLVWLAFSCFSINIYFNFFLWWFYFINYLKWLPQIGENKLLIFVKVASKVLGIPADLVYISETNTSVVPNTTATAGSTGSDLNGMAIKVIYYINSKQVRNSILFNVYKIIYIYIFCNSI